jgi:hypothetical protein
VQYLHKEWHFYLGRNDDDRWEATFGRKCHTCKTSKPLDQYDLTGDSPYTCSACKETP